MRSGRGEGEGGGGGEIDLDESGEDWKKAFVAGWNGSEGGGGGGGGDDDDGRLGTARSDRSAVSHVSARSARSNRWARRRPPASVYVALLVCMWEGLCVYGSACVRVYVCVGGARRGGEGVYVCVYVSVQAYTHACMHVFTYVRMQRRSAADDDNVSVAGSVRSDRDVTMETAEQVMTHLDSAHARHSDSWMQMFQRRGRYVAAHACCVDHA